MSGAAEAAGLTAGGWVFLIAAWVGISAVTAFCFHKVFKTRDRDR